MTEKQIRRRRSFLPQWKDGNPPKLTREEEILSLELDIREMMISNLAYGHDYFEMTKEPWYVRNRSSRGYDWEQLERLGVKNGYERVEQIWKEMKRDFADHATIIYDVYSDSEGLSYNAVEWDDELELEERKG